MEETQLCYSMSVRSNRMAQKSAFFMPPSYIRYKIPTFFNSVATTCFEKIDRAAANFVRATSHVTRVDKFAPTGLKASGQMKFFL